MKKKLLLPAFLFLLLAPAYAQLAAPANAQPAAVAQSPQLSLVGSNFSFTRGNINVEVLAEIIQQKQEQVMDRVLNNLVITNFEKADDAQKSFATYSYIYNLLRSLTLEKNKTVITRQLINNLIEYSLIYGFTNEFMKANPAGQLAIAATNGTNNKQLALTPVQVLSQLQEIPASQDSKVFLKDTDEDEWMALNIMLDMAYDIFLTDTSPTSLHSKGLFKLLIETPTLKQWYEQDNAYLKVKDLPEVQAYRARMLAAYNSFKAGGGVADIQIIYQALENEKFKQESVTQAQYDAMKKILRLAINTLKTYSDNNIIAGISEFVLDYTLIEYRPANTAAAADNTVRGILYIDAEGLISNLYSKYAGNTKRSTAAQQFGFFVPRLFLTVGATHSGAFSSNNRLLPGNTVSENLDNIYFAGEKIGLKFTLADRRYTHAFGPGEEFKFRGHKTYWITPQKDPLISRYELLFYGSGLLYNLVNVKSQENFNYTLFGGAFSITTFNDLIINAGLALPVDAGSSLRKKMLYTFSLDIPIIEYLTALGKKRNAS